MPIVVDHTPVGLLFNQAVAANGRAQRIDDQEAELRRLLGVEAVQTAKRRRAELDQEMALRDAQEKDRQAVMARTREGWQREDLARQQTDAAYRRVNAPVAPPAVEWAQEAFGVPITPIIPGGQFGPRGQAPDLSALSPRDQLAVRDDLAAHDQMRVSAESLFNQVPAMVSAGFIQPNAAPVLLQRIQGSANNPEALRDTQREFDKFVMQATVQQTEMESNRGGAMAITAMADQLQPPGTATTQAAQFFRSGAKMIAMAVMRGKKNGGMSFGEGWKAFGELHEQMDKTYAAGQAAPALVNDLVTLGANAERAAAYARMRAADPRGATGELLPRVFPEKQASVTQDEDVIPFKRDADKAAKAYERAVAALEKAETSDLTSGLSVAEAKKEKADRVASAKAVAERAELASLRAEKAYRAALAKRKGGATAKPAGSKQTASPPVAVMDDAFARAAAQFEAKHGRPPTAADKEEMKALMLAGGR